MHMFSLLISFWCMLFLLFCLFYVPIWFALNQIISMLGVGGKMEKSGEGAWKSQQAVSFTVV
jgi:hypothetical protein